MTQLKTVMVSRLSEHAKASALIPEMSQKEWLDFLKNVEEHGVRQPIDINKKYEVLDGRHRLRAAKKLGIETLQVIQHDFTEDEEIEFVRDTAIERRSLSAAQKLDIIFQSEDLMNGLKEEAKKNLNAARALGGKGGRRASEGPEISSVETSHDSNKKIGEMAGVSRNQVIRAKRIKREEPELYKDVVNGSKTISTAYNELPSVINKDYQKSIAKSEVVPPPKPKQQTNQQPPQLPKEEIDRQMLEANVKTFLNHMEQLTGFFQRTENLEKVIAVAFERNEKAFSEFEYEFEKVAKQTQMEVV